MEDRPERRSCRRVIVGPDHTIRFSAKGHSFQNVRITNLNGSGCFAMISPRDAPLFAQGTFLENFAFEHPDLTAGSIVAKVVYLLGTGSGAPSPEYMGMGIQFVSVDAAAGAKLERFLARNLKVDPRD